MNYSMPHVYSSKVMSFNS